MPTPKQDNGSPIHKLEVRHKIAAEIGHVPKVLEGFIGEGLLWRACWPAAQGIALDKVQAKVTEAASERPGCLCFCGETERAIVHGIGGSVPFDVVDLDCYGQPWGFVRAWCVSQRVRAPLTYIVCTDTLVRQITMVGIPTVLAQPGEDQKLGWNADRYLERAGQKVSAWVEPWGRLVGYTSILPIKGAGRKLQVWQHVLKVAT